TALSAVPTSLSFRKAPVDKVPVLWVQHQGGDEVVWLAMELKDGDGGACGLHGDVGVKLVCKVLCAAKRISYTKDGVQHTHGVGVELLEPGFELDDQEWVEMGSFLFVRVEMSDGTLTDVRTALDDRLKRIRMKYLPKSLWKKSDKDRAAAMIHAIDKRLKTRRIMRSLERFIGGRLLDLQSLLTFVSVFRFKDMVKYLEDNFSNIPRMVNQYMNQQMPEAVREAMQTQTNQLQDSIQRENDEFLKTIDKNMKKIIKEQVKTQVKAQVTRIFPRMEEAVNAQLEAEVLTRSSHSSRTSYDVAADLSKMEVKKILIEKMEGNKSIQRSDEQRNLYKALVEAYDAYKTILDTYKESTSLKRRREDDDQEGPSAGSDRGSKRQRGEGEHASASTPFEPAIGSAGRSTTGSQSRQLSATAQREAQSWIRALAKQTDARSSFNELLDNSIDFSNFIMNRLGVDTLTPKLLAGPTYELMRGSCNSLMELEYHLEEVYKATTDQLDWVNPEGQQYPHNLLQPLPLIPDNRGRSESALDVYSKRRIIAATKLKIVEWHNYKHLDWISIHRDDDKIYKFKEGDLKRLRIQDIKDMLLLFIQGKLSNLTVEERFAFNISLRMFTRSIVIQRRPREAYTAYSNPRGFNYQNKDKKNRLMQIDELHKFSDGTLNDVRNALDDHLKGIRMQYLSTTIWKRGDKARAAAMIQAIDKMLKTRRIMRSLERFVGGRKYERDFRMLQRTI
nr:hypothetical protein [Tanacetum cinerariifolium]